ncbi:MAG: sulfatase family protein [Cellulosilyticaceae bacterium]
MKKNIVVILCDQLRPDFLSLYGGHLVDTPHIDALATMGVVFDQAITQSPVCAPARACMMTGKYVSSHEVWTNDVPFREGLKYLPERMNDAGYHTCAFGKLHHFPADDPKGFQYVRQMEEGRLGADERYLTFLKKRYPDVASVFNVDAQGFKYTEQDYYETWIAEEAIHHITTCVTEEINQPFLAWISFQGPHSPYDPPQEVKDQVDIEQIPAYRFAPDSDISSIVTYRRVLGREEGWEENVKDTRKKYCEMIVAIDRQIGKIMDTLKTLGIFEETVFIFSSDHGDLLNDYDGLVSKGPFPYSAQLNIPLILANHPEVLKGKRSNHLVGNIDIGATVLEIAGDTKGFGQSYSLIEQSKEHPAYTRRVNYSEFCDTMKLVENQTYRFCYYPFTKDTALFDKTHDPNESVNLSGNPEYAQIEMTFLRDIIDFLIISKGIRIEAHDFLPEQQKGVLEKSPQFLDEFVVAHPISSKHELEKLRKAGLDDQYNAFCKGMPVKAHYGCYWNE